jgi:transcription initiation factor TFIIIB Brf1 subunit/transcription initiation factor TFIIB
MKTNEKCPNCGEKMGYITISDVEGDVRARSCGCGVQGPSVPAGDDVYAANGAADDRWHSFLAKVRAGK